MKATVETVKQASVALRRLVNTVLLAKAQAELLREKCDAIQRQVLAAGEYKTSDHWEPRIPVGRVTDPKLAYLMDDDQAPGYYAALDAAYRAAGYTDLKPGHCPALIAEDLLIQAEWALIDAAEQFFPEMAADRLYGETRAKYLDLLIRAVVNYPGYKAPKVLA